MSGHLRRDLAPISDTAWAQIDDSARARLTTYLAARRVVDFGGPHGWTYSAAPIGRSTPLVPSDAPSGSAAAESGAVRLRRREVLPVVELRVDLTLSRDELEDADRGADDIDLDALDRAAERLAIAENGAVFHGLPAAGMTGITSASPYAPIHLSNDLEQWPTSVALAVNTLLSAGIGGPYGLAIGPAGWTGIIETAGHGGQLLFDHLRRILGGPLVWSPGVEGAVVLSLRGGDFRLECGQDVSIGYADHDRDSVHLYLEESFTFRVVEPAAAIALSG